MSLKSRVCFALCFVSIILGGEVVLATGDSEVGKPTADEGSESESWQMAKRGICQGSN